ncbi:MAG: maleylacetoacetate isomerase [Gammaproteobacteria bacterium]|nr:maleylacetoacetate isomerase [Gammaproteobacteria bacterium]
MILYDYARSSASYRVRIALRLKGVSYDTQWVSLTDHQHLEPTYSALNPQKLVPALDIEGHLLSQSLAMIEYLDERYPTPPLLPADPIAKAEVRSLALFIACEMHPLNNLRVREQLQAQFKATPLQITAWCQHWLTTGFEQLETSLSRMSSGLFCYGDSATLADICLIPQLYSAARFQVSLEPYPLIQAIQTHCLTLPAFMA